MIHTDDHKPLFARLLLVFKCFVAKEEYSLALIHRFNQPIPGHEHPKKDAELGLLRVRATPRKKADIIFVKSIIRGALLVEDYGSEHGDERFVVDTIDTDMFIRLRGLHRQLG